MKNPNPYKPSITCAVPESKIASRADWDATSVVTEVAVFEAAQVWRLIRSRNVIAMKADFTKRNPETAEALESIDEHGTPAVAIYSTRLTSEPSVLHGPITEALLGI